MSAAVDVSDASGVAVLILGGCGFVGRHLVQLLLKAAPAAKIRVVDKIMPMMANLSPEHKAAFENPAVEFKQADLSRQAGVDKAFEGCEFRYVFNLTYDRVEYAQTDEVYQQQVVDVSTRAGMMAAQRGVARFVELSTAQVYEPTDKPGTESGSKLKPWTKQVSDAAAPSNALAIHDSRATQRLLTGQRHRLRFSPSPLTATATALFLLTLPAGHVQAAR
jgi:nucleoside-diphosphate-sugar epimerase